MAYATLICNCLLPQLPQCFTPVLGQRQQRSTGQGVRSALPPTSCGPALGKSGLSLGLCFFLSDIGRSLSGPAHRIRSLMPKLLKMGKYPCLSSHCAPRHGRIQRGHFPGPQFPHLDSEGVRLDDLGSIPTLSYESLVLNLSLVHCVT